MTEVLLTLAGLVVGGVTGFYGALWGVAMIAKRDCPPSCMACMARKK